MDDVFDAKTGPLSPTSAERLRISIKSKKKAPTFDGIGPVNTKGMPMSLRTVSGFYFIFFIISFFMISYIVI